MASLIIPRGSNEDPGGHMGIRHCHDTVMSCLIVTGMADCHECQ